MSVFWEPGYPDLPACGPRRAPTMSLYGPAVRPAAQDPREGTKPREENDTKTLPGAASARLLRRGRELKAKPASGGGSDVSSDAPRQRVPAPASSAIAVSVQRRQRRRRFPRSGTKVSPLVLQDRRPQGQQGGCHHRAHHRITVSSFCRRRLLLSG